MPKLWRLFGRSSETEEQEGPPYDRSGPSLSPSPASAASQSTLPEVIESLGMGLFQVRTGLLAGPVWFADGAELILISSVADAVATEWHFNPAERGMVVTLVYLGVLCGNILSGMVGDNVGRRLPILASYLFIFVFSLLSALSWGFWSLGFFRFFVGAAIGLGQPAQQALISEITPTKWRILFTGLGQYFFSFGEIYSGFLVLADDPSMQDVHWRVLLVAGAVPSLIFGILACRWLTQSPLFLACGGRYEETQEVLDAMRHDNSASDVSIDFKMQRVICGGGNQLTKFARMLRTVFGPSHLVTTLVLMVTCFIINLAYYGSLYAFPIVLSSGVNVGSTPASSLVYGGLMETVGVTAGIVAILYLPRLMVIRIYTFLMGVGLAAFAVGAPNQHGGAFTMFLTMFGYYCTKFTASIGFLIFFLYCSEVYPTTVRATGIAVSAAGGRAGAMLCSLLYELLTSISGTFSAFFWVMGVACFLNCALTRLLTVETYDMAIIDGDGGDCAEESIESASPQYGSMRERAASGSPT